MQMLLNEQITQLRKQKKLSQEELAAALQVSRQAVSKWENGVSNPDTENLIRLAEIFEVDVNVLIGSQITPENAPEEKIPDQRKLVRLLSVLLAVAVCVAVLFGGLWLKERETRLEMLADITEQRVNRWHTVKLYHYVAGNREEVSLSEEDIAELTRQIWSYNYTVIEEDEIELVYAMPIVVEFTGGDTTYIWNFYGNHTKYAETFDGYTWNTYYKTDEAFFNWITTFLE
jgi:transcriptional regulator with XRE-family HTH domain